MNDYKYIELSNGKHVQAVFQSEEIQTVMAWNGHYAYKNLTDGKTCKEIVFVDLDGNQSIFQ